MPRRQHIALGVSRKVVGGAYGDPAGSIGSYFEMLRVGGVAAAGAPT